MRQSGFFMAMSLIPIGYLMYQFTGPGNYEHKYLTRVINSYDGYRKDAAHIAALHTDALEQAAADRNLFANTQRAQNVTLRFPEYVLNLFANSISTAAGNTIVTTEQREGCHDAENCT